jgi:DNA-binding NarL/FixJ family response regulator
LLVFTVATEYGTHAPSPEQSKQPAQGQSLTSRERQIIRLVAEARKTKEIALRLKLTDRTIKTYHHPYIPKASRTASGLRSGVGNRDKL